MFQFRGSREDMEPRLLWKSKPLRTSFATKESVLAQLQLLRRIEHEKFEGTVLFAHDRVIHHYYAISDAAKNCGGRCCEL